MHHFQLLDIFLCILGATVFAALLSKLAVNNTPPATPMAADTGAASVKYLGQAHSKKSASIYSAGADLQGF